MKDFIPAVSDREIKIEKHKARLLKRSPWWRNRISKGKCYYCGKSTPPNELTMDHVVPLIRGGKSTKSNIVPCCKECNNKKKYLLPMEWECYLKELASSDPEKIL
ncbi:MAG: HNH endonuclease [Thermodesulfovibrio sp.]|nr:HNH endonuclease [Thermodesulfovibrio sp.]